MQDKILSIKNLCVSQDSHKILDNISFEVERGETVAIIGPNGAGKTTLLKTILGLIPYQGEIYLAPGTKIGYVPQRLFIEKDIPVTSEEFLKIKEGDKKKIEEALAAVGINQEPHQKDYQSHILKNKLGNLSAGELQKVLIAWALLGNPNLLLFDEPTAGVDIFGEKSIYLLLEELKKTKDITIILVSHELGIVFKHATNVVCINKERVCFGPPRKTLTTATLEKLFGTEAGIYRHKN